MSMPGSGWFDEFTRIRFGPPDFHKPVIDPLTHVFDIQTTEGDMNRDSVDPKAPLVVWALETHRALEVCAGVPQKLTCSAAKS